MRIDTVSTKTTDLNSLKSHFNRKNVVKQCPRLEFMKRL